MGTYTWNGKAVPCASVDDVRDYLVGLKQQCEDQLSHLQEALQYMEFSYEDCKQDSEPDIVYMNAINVQKTVIEHFTMIIRSVDHMLNDGQPLGLVAMVKALLEQYGYPPQYFIPMKDKVKDFFVDNGYIITMSQITDKGRGIGLSFVDRVSATGEAFIQLVFSEQAVQLVSSYVPQFKQEIDASGKPLKYRGRSAADYIEAYSPVFGKEIKFKRKFMEHEFTTEEVEKLLRGEEITILCKDKRDRIFEATGTIKYQENVRIYGKDFSFYGFYDPVIDQDPNWYDRKVMEYENKRAVGAI